VFDREVDVVPASPKADGEAVVPQPLLLQPRPDPHRVQEVHRALLEHPRPHTIDHVVAAAILHDDGIDAVQVKQLAQQQARRTGTDDSDLSPTAVHAEPETQYYM
jgi:hypothetical protein